MNLTAKKMLLLDGVGALVTATMLSQVLARHVPLFGMPKEVLHILSGVALCFAVFSLTSHLLVKSGFDRYLSIILIANITYCITTLVLMGVHIEKLTWLGIAYFIGEVIIVLILVYAEYRKV
ncbi:MAG: hypothetical protein RIC19_21005 [Phaeodactylibacter sp.]|uniref:hypothetical protein n=1 Tax=Phaeodactylibacter sp. TaxID=1940289 RepID=UPI0032EAEF80